MDMERIPVKRNSIILGDCLEVLKKFPSNSVSAVVTDPPYGLSAQPDMREVLKHWLEGDDYEHSSSGFMGKGWDSFVPGPKIWEEVMRVLKPGGHILSFSGTRTYDLMVTAMRLAGSEIRDQINVHCELETCRDWTYGCLSDDTELFINGRWEHYHKAIAGLPALCYNMEDDSFSMMPIQEVFVYDYDDTAYRIQSDTTDQIVSRNHRCIIERGGKKEFRVAESLVCGHGDSTRKQGKTNNVEVPIVEGMQNLWSAISLLEDLRQEKEKGVFSPMHSETRCSNSSEQADVGKKRSGESDMLSVQERSMEIQSLVEGGQRTLVFKKVRGGVERERICEAWIQREGGVDGRECQVAQGENDGTKEPCVERRSDVLQDSRELQGSEIYPVSAGIHSNGSQRWVCDGASYSGRSGDRKIASETGSCSSCESRPDRQSSGELGVVCQQSGAQVIRGSRYTTTTMARIEPFHYVGKVWCIRVPTGAFVARRNGKVFITGNSGFPKSLNVSKQIEKEIIEAIQAQGIEFTGWDESDGITPVDKNIQVVVSGKEMTVGIRNGKFIKPKELLDWSGKGSCLKPAHEPIADFAKGDAKSLDGTPFYYTAKTASKERDAGCKHLFWKMVDGSHVRISEEEHSALEKENEEKKGIEGFKQHLLASGNPHPCVKPIQLCRWLVKMVKMPSDNLILDCFCGSGSILCACALEDCDFIGIDMDPMSVELSKARSLYWKLHGKR